MPQNFLSEHLNGVAGVLVVAGVHVMLMTVSRGGSTSRYGVSCSLLVVIMMRGGGSVPTVMRMIAIVMSGHLCVRLLLRIRCHDAAPYLGAPA